MAANTTAQAGVDDLDPLAAFLTGVRAGKPVSHANLTLYPLFTPASGPAVITLAEALRAHSADVTEIGEAGHVPALWVRNRGGRPVLIFDGEELVGAKQNRIVNTTILVAAGSELEIPVSCVEQGRWAWRSRHFASEGRMLQPQMRSSKSRRIAHSLVSDPGSYDADQTAVWGEVHAYAARRQAHSATGALADVYEKDRPQIDSYVGKFTPLPLQTGAAAFVNGKLVSVDILGRPDAYAALSEALVRSLAAQAVDRHGERSVSRRTSPLRALRAFAHGTRSESRPPGFGRDLRLLGGGLHGSALLADDGIVHVAAFPAAEHSAAA